MELSKRLTELVVEGWVLGIHQTKENHDGPNNVECRYFYSLKLEK